MSKLRSMLILSLALAVVPACKKTTYQFETSAPATAGLAEIVMTVDKTGNGEITFEFEHLAPPKNIDSSLAAYVVWMQIEGKDPAKLGVLEFKDEKRFGSLSATYSAQQMKIIVTVETNPSASAPIGARILEVDVTAPRG